MPALIRAGIEGHCIDITKFDQQGRYTVIGMADVPEHMPYPKKDWPPHIACCSRTAFCSCRCRMRIARCGAP